MSSGPDRSQRGGLFVCVLWGMPPDADTVSTAEGHMGTCGGHGWVGGEEVEPLREEGRCSVRPKGGPELQRSVTAFLRQGITPPTPPLPPRARTVAGR